VEIFAELNEKGDRCAVYFRYSDEVKNAVKSIPGSRFVPANGGNPAHWTMPLDLPTMRLLRARFGKGLTLGTAIKAWGRVAVGEEEQLRSMVVADDIPIDDLIMAKKLPDLAEWFRPHQRADVKFMGATSCLNLLEPRLGKTTEVIGAIFESDLENGAHLVVAPKTTLDQVWRYEIERWTDHVLVTYSGDLNQREKVEVERTVDRCLDKGRPFWFVTTADMIRRGNFPDLVQWNSFTIDEYHKTGLPEKGNVFSKAAVQVPTRRKFALSGTPMGGKPIKLYGALHFLFPTRFPSKWNWAYQWLQVENSYGNHKKIGKIRPGLEDQFYLAHAQYMLRRLRKEVRPQLPDKLWIDVDVDMTRPQNEQYVTFARDAEIRIEEYHLSATSILAEYTRLKQFANHKCTVEAYEVVDEETGRVNLKVKATEETGKIPALLQRLAEEGIDPDDPTGDSQAIVVSQFRETAEMIVRHLTKIGVGSEIISGPVKQKDRNEIMARFQDGELRVVVLVTAAAGVGITLSRANTVHLLDETWNPDDQEQVADRALDLNDLHQVTVFTYRSKGTIEQYIQGVTGEKMEINRDILDLRRQGLRAIK
jgi:SNF2 family DNA or RNA helicase